MPHYGPGVEILLTEPEQAIARYIAKRRFEANRSNGVENRRVGPQDDATTDLEGFASELAYCKLFNTFPDFSISVRQGGHDSELLGVRMDVKGTAYRNGHLLAVVGKQAEDVDIYALMVGRFPAYRFAGCATAAELLRPERITDFGHGPTYAMKQAELFAYCTRHGTYPADGRCEQCEKVA